MYVILFLFSLALVQKQRHGLLSKNLLSKLILKNTEIGTRNDFNRDRKPT